MEAFAQSNLSSSKFYPSQVQAGPAPEAVDVEQPTQQASLPANIPGPGPRNYKSRKYRPCDFCRNRQVACKIETAPPCQLCQSHGRDCTFVEQPKKKRRPKTNASSRPRSLSRESTAPEPSLSGHIGRFTLASQGSTGSGSDVGPPQHQQRSFPPYTQPLDPHLTAISQGHETAQAHAGYMPHFDEHLYDRRLAHPEYAQPHEHGLAHNPGQDFRAASGLAVGQHDQRLESATARPLRFVGETGEVNPYLLRCYHYDEQDECTVSRQTFRRVKKIPRVTEAPGAKDEPPVMFAFADESHARLGEPRVDSQTLAQFQHEVADMFTEEEKFRLIGLYFRFIDPYFPIFARSELFVNGLLSQHAIHNLPLAVLSALYAAALPFVLYDDLLSATVAHGPDHSQHLYRIAWLALTQEAHTPRLCSIQAALLILQRPPSEQYSGDTPWKTSFIGWMVSLSNTLGLHRDASEWNIPAWELALRKRLWHAVMVMDKWTCLGAGVPSHIRSDDVDVQPIWPSDVEPSEVVDAEYHFRLLTELTSILSETNDKFFSVRAAHQLSKNFSHSFEEARSLRARLRDWSDAMAPYHKEGPEYSGGARVSGDNSLRLAFIVANMTLLKAILRPVENMSHAELQDHSTVGSRMAVRQGAMECAKEAVDFVELLGRPAIEAFWHSWSRTNFGIASAFLVQLLLTAHTEAEVNEINDLIARWRWCMRLGGTGHGIMSPGLLRFDGLSLDASEIMSADGSIVGMNSHDLDRRTMSVSVPL